MEQGICGGDIDREGLMAKHKKIERHKELDRRRRRRKKRLKLRAKESSKSS
jgi:hypothetical protein